MVDPWNRTNLITDTKLEGIREKLRRELDQWMKVQGDLGQATELKAFERMPSKSVEGAAKKKKKKKG
jgi:uncharacterized sulfatase